MDVLAVLTDVSDLLWSEPTVFLLFALFIIISVRAGFPQRHILRAMRVAFTGCGVFRSLSMNLAAVLGVGNILGVALAVTAGGAGAVFWCALAGFVGMGVQYMEARLAIRHRRTAPDGAVCGGAMYVLRAAGLRKAAVLYAVLLCAGGLAMGALIPANANGEVLAPTDFPLPAIAAILALAAILVLMGGARRVYDFCVRLTPVLVVLYCSACIAVLVICRDVVGEAVMCILREAFAPHAAVAGLTGQGIACAARWGLARGLFSNEAGMGTIGVGAAAAGDKDAEMTALGCACSGVWDTVILATLTGLAYVAASLAVGADGDALAMARRTFALVPTVGEYVLPTALIVLGFSTIIGWYAIAEQGWRYVFARKNPRAFAYLWVAAVFVGTTASLPLIWTLSDIANAGLLTLGLTAVLRGMRRNK